MAQDGKNHDEDVKFLTMGVKTKNRELSVLFDRLAQVICGSHDGILLWGDAGTGKTTLARRIYEYKKQAKLLKGPLIEVNCAALEEREALTVLFGEQLPDGIRPGAFAAASGGILILDEVDRLSEEARRRVLAALESGVFRPLGALEETPCQFDLVSAARLSDGEDYMYESIQEEFFSRIAIMQFRLPSLKELTEDFGPIVEYVLAEIGNQEGRPVRFEQAGLDWFLNFAQSPGALWSGNYRDLYRILKRMNILSGGGVIQGEVVRQETDALLQQWNIMEKEAAGGPFTYRASVETANNPIEELEYQIDGMAQLTNEEAFAKLVDGVHTSVQFSTDLTAVLDSCDEFEKAQLLAVLEVCRSSGSMAEAGRKLFDKSRARRVSVNDSDRLKKYLARFGLDWETVKG
jgi:transcriptional regulatory protein RtcR